MCLGCVLDSLYMRSIMGKSMGMTLSSEQERNSNFSDIIKVTYITSLEMKRVPKSNIVLINRENCRD